MNWRTGLFRVWITASVCWVVLTAVLAYQAIIVPQQQAAAAFDACKADNEGNGWRCITGISFGAENPVAPYLPYLFMAVAGPLAMIAAWFAVKWVRDGFAAKSN